MNKDLSFLNPQAASLDFTDPEDRAIFRIRVTARLNITKMSCINGWTNSKARSRKLAIYILCNHYFKQVAPNLISK